MSTSLIEITDLRISVGNREIVRGVDLQIGGHERVGIVGESGSGKTLTALAMLRLLPRAGRVTAGSIVYRGRNLTTESDRVFNALRGTAFAMVFQNAAAALNPVLKVGRQVSDVLAAHAPPGRPKPSPQEVGREAVELLASTGLPNPAAVMHAFPHQLSGGMAQRVLIAMALSAKPELLVADEPTTGLDMSIQAQVLRLLKNRLSGAGSALLLISHDIAVVGETCDRIAVMYAGRIVEMGPAESVLTEPLHPYTRALVECASGSSITLRGVMPTIPGEPPDLDQPVAGCAFAPRCPRATQRCVSEAPVPRMITDSQMVECHHA